jgi:hypothetical protein
MTSSHSSSSNPSSLQVAAAVLEESDSHVPFRMFVINCTQVRASLREKALQLAHMLMAQVLKATSDRNRFLCERFAEIQAELQKDLTVSRALYSPRGCSSGTRHVSHF